MSIADVSFGSFALRRLLHAGRASQTWVATSAANNAPPRLRLTTFGPQGPVSKRLLGHAAALVGAQHPHLGRVYESGWIEGTPFVASEHVEGPTLTAILRRLEVAGEAVPRWLARRVTEACLAVLDRLREDGVSPIGLHPSSITVSFSGAITLSIVDEIALEHGVEPAWVGGAGYLSPEEIRRQSVGFEADDYALGVLLHHLLAGRHPRAAASAAELLLSVISTEPPQLSLSVDLAPLAQSIVGMQANEPFERSAAREAARSQIAALPLATTAEAAAFVCSLFAEDAPARAFQPAVDDGWPLAVEILAEPAAADEEEDTSPIGLSPLPAPPIAEPEPEPIRVPSLSSFDLFSSTRFESADGTLDIFAGYSSTGLEQRVRDPEDWFSSDPSRNPSRAFDGPAPKLKVLSRGGGRT